jgi:hypothetical protein
MHLWTALPGEVSGDTGVYVWNLWVFRHAIVAHREMPFFTLEILSLAPAMPLTLQNYTTLANVIAFPLIPLLGIVATFNVLVISSGVAAAYSMFLCARRLTGDTAASWVAGLAFGFSPFMSARATEHFSLIQTAPLPLFVMLFERLHFRPTFRVAAAAGITVACALSATLTTPCTVCSSVRSRLPTRPSSSGVGRCSSVRIAAHSRSTSSSCVSPA